MAREKIFRVRFAAFELRCCLSGTKYFQTVFAEQIDHADHQGRFRADDGKGNFFFLRQLEQRLDIGRGYVDIAALAFGRRTGIAWRYQHFADAA